MRCADSESIVGYKAPLAIRPTAYAGGLEWAAVTSNPSSQAKRQEIRNMYIIYYRVVLTENSGLECMMYWSTSLPMVMLGPHVERIKYSDRLGLEKGVESF